MDRKLRGIVSVLQVFFFLRRKKAFSIVRKQIPKPGICFLVRYGCFFISGATGILRKRGYFSARAIASRKSLVSVKISFL